MHEGDTFGNIIFIERALPLGKNCFFKCVQFHVSKFKRNVQHFYVSHLMYPHYMGHILLCYCQLLNVTLRGGGIFGVASWYYGILGPASDNVQGT